MPKKNKICEKIKNSLNPFNQCREYGIPLWQCPSFLFLLMGVIIIGFILATYYIASSQINDPAVVSLIVIFITTLLLVIDFIITRSFETVTEASKMKSEFISVVSHQLRGPLTNLKYSLEVIVNGPTKKSKKDQEYLDLLQENTKRMGTLINNLLMVSRIETGRMPLRKEMMSMDKIVVDMVKKYKAFSEASNVKVNVKYDKNLPKIEADPLWFEEIIQNLLDNAIRYIKEKGTVDINMTHTKTHIHFSIRDNGMGIPKEAQKYIFQKFFRSKNVLKHRTDGSGLGLYIAKQIISLMGGKIWFKSEEGKGTTFFFMIPYKRSK